MTTWTCWDAATTRLTFSPRDFLLTMRVAPKRATSGSDLMTFGSGLSVITAYLAMAFVGAIVLGMI